MNFSEFKKLLGADPKIREPETRRARASGEDFDRAVAEAEVFESKLEAALEIPVDSKALICAALSVTARTERRMPRWMAMAAGLVIVAGVAGLVMVNRMQQPATIEQYLAGHYAHDGEKFLTRALEGSGTEAQEIRELMATWDLAASDELLVKISYFDRCPTMDGPGAHMVVQTDKGMISLIVMPKTRVRDRQIVTFDGMQARLVAFSEFSAAIIGREDQQLAAFDAVVRRSISKSI